jgi:DNA-directed RNA polymerase specialized sigma subunit
MTAKEYLGQLRGMDISINAKMERLEHLRVLAEYSSSFTTAGKRNNVRDKIGKTVANIIDLENEIKADIDKLVEMEREVREAIAQIDDSTLRTLIEYRYINSLTIEKTAEKMSYSVRAISHVEKRALNEFSRLHCFTGP